MLPDTRERYTLSLHDALPICLDVFHPDVIHDPEIPRAECIGHRLRDERFGFDNFGAQDRKSTRLNSSHLVISYAVFCLKKKKSNNSRRHDAMKDVMTLDVTIH